MSVRRLLLVATLMLACAPATARAQVVALGDSAISGEAGRWAGNTNGSSSRVLAGAYDDAIADCHRSLSAEVHIGGGVQSLNLACSGAQTSTHTAANGDFKPGLDFYDSGGKQGQALMLQQYAAAHPVKAVVVLIGANDYGFADIVEDCVIDWLTSPSWWKDYCQDDSSIKSMFTTANIAKVTADVKAAYQRVAQAMTNAGYTASRYTIVAQLYSSPIPSGSRFRYGETGYTRQTVGGCGIWNKDADWANASVVTTLNTTIRNAVAQSGLTNVKLLDTSALLDGRRLCENTVGLLEEKGVATWQSPGAADKTEWVSQIRTATTLVGPYQLQEDAHPNYWGQLALRNCFRQAYNGGAVRGGTCTHGTGLDPYGEPNATLSAG
jgi:lysophospholipase L1-like esterase